MANKNIEDLVEPFRTKVKLRLADNPEVFVTETTRTKARQRELVQQWYSKTMDSNHLKGTAVDIAFYWPELYPTDYNKRRKLANSALNYWIDWGYDMRHRDKPHFQDNWQPLSYNKLKMELDYIKILNEEFPNRTPLFDYETYWQVKALIEIGLLRMFAKQKEIDITEVIKVLVGKLKS